MEKILNKLELTIAQNNNFIITTDANTIASLQHKIVQLSEQLANPTQLLTVQNTLLETSRQIGEKVYQQVKQIKYSIEDIDFDNAQAKYDLELDQYQRQNLINAITTTQSKLLYLASMLEQHTQSNKEDYELTDFVKSNLRAIVRILAEDTNCQPNPTQKEEK